jgi:hypothetical protein
VGKRFVSLVGFFLFCAAALSAQHRVNDVKEHQGWFQIEVKIEQSGNISYAVTQCYPNGEEYKVKDSEKEKLPLYLKVFCLVMVDEGFKDSFNFADMSMNEDGYLMQVTALSFTLILDFSKPENEILEELGDEVINQYRYRKW